MLIVGWVGKRRLLRIGMNKIAAQEQKWGFEFPLHRIRIRRFDISTNTKSLALIYHVCHQDIASLTPEARPST